MRTEIAVKWRRPPKEKVQREEGGTESRRSSEFIYFIYLNSLG